MLAHDAARGIKTDIYWYNCFIGVGAIILPEVSIGDNLLSVQVVLLPKIYLQIVSVQEIQQR